MNTGEFIDIWGKFKKKVLEKAEEEPTLVYIHCSGLGHIAKSDINQDTQIELRDGQFTNLEKLAHELA